MECMGGRESDYDLGKYGFGEGENVVLIKEIGGMLSKACFTLFRSI